MGVGTPVPLLVGIVLILFGVGLFFLDTFKPGYKRNSDTVYAVLFLAVGILSLLIWNAGFAEALQLMVAAGTLVALMIERIQNRSANGEPIRAGGARSPRRDNPDYPSRSYRSGYDERPSTPVRAEFEDDPFPMEEPPRVRRIRGGRESEGQDRYSTAYVDQLPEENRSSRRTERRSSSSYDGSSYDDEPSYSDERSRRRSPLQLEGDRQMSDSSGAYSPASGSESTPRRRRSSNPAVDAAADEILQPSSSRGRRRRGRSSNGDGSASEWSTRSNDSEYVDFKPLRTSPKPSRSEDEFDNSSNFDDAPDFS